jgi:Ser/Thr protein kinase RdoA (MazF antagonist)
VPASDPDQVLSLLGVGPGRVVLLKDVPLARLHLTLRGATESLGQRPGWRPLHSDVCVRSDRPWEERVSGLASVSPRLASWARAAAEQARAALAAVRADDLPVMVVHGDFAAWNVHYDRERLAGVIDFGLTHVDSRPYELAIARTYRAPEMTDAYRAELASCGWPLSELEEAALTPVYRAFRVGMAAAERDSGLVAGDYDLAMIERQLSRTATAPPLSPGLGHY